MVNIRLGLGKDRGRLWLINRRGKIDFSSVLAQDINSGLLNKRYDTCPSTIRGTLFLALALKTDSGRKS